jgi:hypothetical protein
MYITDIIIRKLPLKLLLWLVRSKFGKRDVETFTRFLSSNNWEKVNFNPEKWIFRDDNSFVIEEGVDRTDFHEEWIDSFPDKTAKSKEVYLKINGELVNKPLRFVSADGGRYFVPMPSIGEAHGERYYYWDKDSLEYKVCKIIGEYYREKNLDEVGNFCGVLIKE